MLKSTLILFIALCLATASCTGGNNATVQDSGAIKIAPGEVLTIDVQDVIALNVPEFTLSLRSVSTDYSTSKILLDFTSLVALQLQTTSKIKFIVPKNISTVRPLLVVADIPSLNAQLVQVLYDGDASARPGIASSLAYELMKYYPQKALAEYSSIDFHGIQDLIQARTDQLISESENLNLATLPFPKLMRYFKNGIAFNVNFLTQIRQFGVNYTFDLATPPGLQASDTPELSLIPYQYAINFKVSGLSAQTNPLNHNNNPPMLTPGASQPNPGTNLFITEGNPVSVSAQGFDIDDDFIDKNMIIQYIPRVLPKSLTTLSTFPVIPEPTPEYAIITRQTDSVGVDQYTSNVIGYNEALDTSVYPSSLAIDPVLYPAPGALADTAYRNIYYLISDGMIRVPYRWNFKYSDTNRQPKIVRDLNGKMNDTYFDNTLAPGELEVATGTGWKLHGSHCESDPAFSYQTITSKSDGPWSCAFKMIDPDIDDDPNAAADTFNYTLIASDNSSIITTNFAKMWPQYVPPFAAPRFSGTMINNCITPDGKRHYRCGVGLYQVTIDNSVKAAAESKTSQSYNYDVVIYDRPVVLGGNSVSASLGRTIQLLPQPARLVNYSDPVTPGGTLGLSLVDMPTNTYVRKDTYLSELLNLADPAHALTNLSDIGIGSSGLNSSLAGIANRSAFMAGSSAEITSFASQPHTISGSTVTLDAVTYQATSASPGSLSMFGHSMTTADVSTYSKPREFDATCSLATNNKGAGWDQDAQGGWTFEIDAVDYDNVALSVGEASDPVHLQLSTDISATANAVGLQYCNYLTPNSDPAYYQTYLATSLATAVDAEKCTWTTSAPADMQPMPIYYTVSVAGMPTVKKWVYHRLRLKWQPRDQGMLGKTVADPPFFIKNLISAGLQLSGNRFQLKGDTLDLTTLPAPLNLFANRIDMKPCITGLTGGFGVVHQLSTAPAVPVRFGVSDENKVLWKTPTVPGAAMGKFEAEWKAMGTRSINSPSFLQLVPYMLNCTTRDVDLASTPSSPPATVSGSEPAIWYSQASDSSNIPRLRFQTATDPSLLPMCFNYSLNPAKKGSSEYNEVVVIQNTSATPFTLSNAFLSTCSSRTNIAVSPDQKFIAIASTCGSGHTLGQSLWSDASSSGTVAYVANPTLVANGGLPAGTSLALDLLPSFYQASLAVNFPADFDLPNALFFDASVFDTFRLDSVTGVPKFSGYFQSGAPTWLSNDSTTTLTNALPLTPAFAAPGYAFGWQTIDWENQPNYLTIATPTPNPATSSVFFRMAPGDSTRIQVYVKNHATATFPLQVSDVSNVLPLEMDPYDIITFGLVPPGSVPSATPSFTGITRSDCISAPASYPAVSTLNVNSLANYKKCSFSWTPTAADDGKKFAYTFTAQDNFGATASVPGVGGRHPAGSGNTGFSLLIPNDGVAKTNGPSVIFNLDIESLEANIAPFFTDAGGANVIYPYSSAGGSAGWNSVYGANTPAGAQSSCGAPSSGFSCGLSISSGDTLQSSTTTQMVEGAQQTFTVYAKDSNITSQLKTLTATAPTSVLIVDGPHQGNTFLVPSFASLPVSSNQNVATGTANFSFSWTPTDSEANYLSNAGGFLIPMVISDQAYSPATDSGFPTQFTVPAKQSKVWIWAKISVRNSQPQVFYISGGSEIPLDSAALLMQTGGTTNYPIRIKDTDIARWIQSNDMTGFLPSYTGPSFTGITSTSSPTLSGNFIIQDFVISGTPLNSDVGTYSSPQVSVTDPGDISLGLAINPDTASPPKARVFPANNQFNVQFSLQVIGKPQFLAPGSTASTSQAYAYSSRPFSYPLALSISRQNEMQQPFFMGIDASTAITPIKRSVTGAGSTGIYVSHVSDTAQNNFIVKWPDSTSFDIITTGSPDRIVPIHGVKAAYCNVTDGSAYPAVTLIRYNETSSAIETCNLSANNVATNASSANLTISLMDNSQLLNPVTLLTLTEANRVLTTSPAPSNLSLALDKQFADFFGRCTNCSVGPTVCDATPSGLALNVTSTVGQTCTEPGTSTARTGFAKYDYNSYSSMFIFDTNSGFSIKKVYQDILPGTARTTNIAVNKGELLHLIATPAVPADTKYQYRWYVNGCLKASGLLTSAPMNYDLKVTTTMGGLNNDCTGEYGYAEPGATSLGKLVVKLSLVKGNELLSGASESSVNSYIWNIAVLNTDPSIVTANTYAPSSPLSLSSQFTGNMSVQFASPVSYSSKNYFAYTDLSSISGLKVRLTELDSTGNIATGGSTLALNCDSIFNLQPEWIGIQPQVSGKLAISVSTNSSYPISGANIAYSAKDQTCFTNMLTTTVPSVSPVVYDSSGSTVPAGYLAFSKYSLSLRPLATFANVSPLYQSGTNDADYYLIEGKSATSQFWSYNLAGLYASNPVEFQAPYANNSVRRNILSGTNLFQLIGANTSNSTGWRGFILNRTLTPSSNQIATSGTNRIMFADPAANPPPAATDCKFNGTPLDAIYVPALSGVNVDTLYVLATGSAIGKIVAIQNATGAAGTPTCVEIGDVKNPSLLNSEHNPNLSKMVFDPARGTIYGLINPGGGAGGQFYAIDVYSKQLVTRDLSATLSPYELIYSSAINALYLFDNRKSTNPVLSPMLYKIW